MAIFTFSRPARMLSARLMTIAALVAVVIAPLAVVATSTSAAASDMVSMTKSAPERALVGGDIDYSLSATSTHSVLLFNLSFRDVLPAGVTYTAGSTSPASMGEPTQVAELDGSNNPTGRTILIWTNVADLAAQETVTLHFSAHTDEEVLPTGAQAVNEGNAYVSTFERRVPRFNSRGDWVPHPQIQGSLEASATTAITPITIDKSEPNPENELMRGVQDNWTTYTLTLRNNHANPTTDPTTDLTVVDYLPAGLEFLGCRTADNSAAAEYSGAGSLAGGGDTADCSVEGQTVTCVLTDGLGVNQQVEVELLVAVGPAAAPSVTNTVTVSTPSEDTDPKDDTSTVTTPVEPTAVLAIEKTLADVDGDAATWQITVTNDGPSATDEAIVFVDTLPNYLAYAGHSGAGWVCEVVCDCDGARC